MPNPLKQFFSFSKIERYGFYAVLFLIFISIAVKAYLPEFYKSETTLNYNEEIAQFEKQIKQLEQTNNNQKTAQEKQVSSISKTQTEKRNFTNPKKSIQNTFPVRIIRKNRFCRPGPVQTFFFFFYIYS